MTPDREPAAYAEIARLVVAVLVGLGWVTVDSATANLIATVIGGVLSIALTLAVRQHVTPVSSDTATPDALASDQ
jgi:hypothetical protein